MTGPGQHQSAATVLIYAVLLAVVVWRMMRPTRVSAVRIWIRPALLLVLTGMAIWGESVMGHLPVWEVSAYALGGAVLGVPLGVLRGKHSDVRATEHAGVYYVHSSPLIVVVWVAALLARAVVRVLLPSAGGGVSLLSMLLLGFAASAIVVSAFLVYGKLRIAQRVPA